FCDLCLFGVRELVFQLARNVACDITLQRNELGLRLVVLRAEYHILGLGIDHLERDACSTVTLRHTSVDDRLNPKLSTDGFGIDLFALVPKNGGPRLYLYVRKLGKAAYQRFRHTITEVLDIRIATFVHKGHDRHRSDLV